MISLLFVSLRDINSKGQRCHQRLYCNEHVLQKIRGSKLPKAGERKAIFFVIKVRDWIGVLIGCLICALVFEPKERLH